MLSLYSRTRQRVLLLQIIMALGMMTYIIATDVERMNITVGGNITLSCPISPELIGHYKWVYVRAGTKRPQVISSGRQLVVGEPRFSIQLKRSEQEMFLQLNLVDVKKYEAGLFMCWRLGEKPYPQVYMQVNDEIRTPVITATSGLSSVPYSDQANFTCIAEAPLNSRVQWLMNNRSILPVDKVYKQSLKRNGNIIMSGLHITSLRRSGVFTCKIFSLSDVVHHDFHVNVVVPRVISLVSHPSYDHVQYGQDYTLTCTISGSNTQVVWLKDGKIIYPSNNKDKDGNTKIMNDGEVISTIVIKNFNKQNNGQYVCYLPGSSKSLLVNIEGRPPRLLGISGNDFLVSDLLNLTCCTQYDRHSVNTRVLWEFEGRTLDPSWDIHMNVERQGQNITCYHLMLDHTTLNHSGVYKCITPFGTASTNIVPAETTSTSVVITTTTTTTPTTTITTSEIVDQVLPQSVQHIISENQFTPSGDNNSYYEYGYQEKSTNIQDLSTISQEMYHFYNRGSTVEDSTSGTAYHETKKTTFIKDPKYVTHYDYYYYNEHDDYDELESPEIVWIDELTPSSVQAVEGERAILQCIIHSSSEVVVLWEKQGEESNMLIAAGQVKVARDNRISFENKGDANHDHNYLIIDYVKKEDAGNYTCYVYKGKEKITREIKLSVIKQTATTTIIPDFPTTVQTTVLPTSTATDPDSTESINVDLHPTRSDGSSMTTEHAFAAPKTTMSPEGDETNVETSLTSTESVTTAPWHSVKFNKTSNVNCSFYAKQIETNVELFKKLYNRLELKSKRRQDMIYCLQLYNNNTVYQQRKNNTKSSETNNIRRYNSRWFKGTRKLDTSASARTTTATKLDKRINNNIKTPFKYHFSSNLYKIDEENDNNKDSNNNKANSNNNNNVGSTNYNTNSIKATTVDKSFNERRNFGDSDSESGEDDTDLTTLTNGFISNRINSSSYEDNADYGSGDSDNLDFPLDNPALHDYTGESGFHPYTYDNSDYSNTMEDIDDQLWMAHDLLGLPCPVDVSAEEIIWKKEDTILFLGLLDLTGESGMFVNKDGILHLTGTDTGWYTCYIQHPVTLKEYPVKSYYIILKGLDGEQYLEIMKEKDYNVNMKNDKFNLDIDIVNDNDTEGDPLLTDSNPNVTTVDIIATDLQIAEMLGQILKHKPDYRTKNIEVCKMEDEIVSLESAHNAIKTCQDILNDQLDSEVTLTLTAVNFRLNLLPGGWYSSTLIDVSKNKDTSINSHSHTPFIPYGKSDLAVLDKSSYKATLEETLRDIKLLIE